MAKVAQVPPASTHCPTQESTTPLEMAVKGEGPRLPELSHVGIN